MDKSEEKRVQLVEDYYASIIILIRELAEEDYKIFPSEQLEKIRNLTNKIVE